MSDISSLQEADTAIAPRVSDWKRFRRVFFHRKLVVAAVAVLVLLALTAIFAPLIAPYGPSEKNLAESLQNPNADHWLGTDKLGKDVFSDLVYGARTVLYVGFGTVAVSAVVGVILGLLAGFLGGVVNGVIMRVMDALMGFPMLVLALLLAAVLGGGLQNVIIALAVATLPGYTRLMCSETLRVRENEYIMAQRAIGSRSLRTMVRHVLPNAFQPTMVLVTTMLGNVILAEAGLSFIGIGIKPPGVAWGSMASSGFRLLQTHPLVSFAPAIAIALVVFAFNMVGDGLRDALDPRLRGKL